MQSVLKEKEKLRVLMVKNTFLRRISLAFLASGPVDWIMGATGSGHVTILS